MWQYLVAVGDKVDSFEEVHDDTRRYTSQLHALVQFKYLHDT